MVSEDISQFTKLATKYKVLDKPEEKRLIALAQKTPPDASAWNKLIRHNYKLVIHIAKRYTNQGLSFEDLIQEGLIGLCIAIQKFDLNQGALSTYATWWIRQAITRAIDNNSRPIRIPIHKLNEYRVVRRVYRQFVERWGGQITPSSEELSVLITKAAEIDPKKRIKAMTKDEVEFLGRMLHPTSSLDETNSEDENLTGLDFLKSAADEQPEAVIELKENKTRLLGYLKQLDPEEQIFIMLKFGLLDGKERDKKEMSAYKRLSDGEVQRKTDSILAKLRRICPMEEFNLDL